MIEPMVVGEGHETPKPGLALPKSDARPPPTDRAVGRDTERSDGRGILLRL
jgi:hypothetical protein